MILRQQAFAGKKKFLKGGLHCHTVRSDGRMTPEEVIALHKENGYDFLAITDHRRYNFTNFAPEHGVTIIPGMEFDNTLPCETGHRCFHTVCLGPSKEDGNGFEQDEHPLSGTAKDQEEYQPILDEIHAKKNITIYCHPQWSFTPARYFEKQKGNFAMEIWNSGCAFDNQMDNDAAYWDELLEQGIKIYGVATDDGHSLPDHCHGWVMVDAENNINSILKALEEGKFYSTCGPEIYDFYIEDRKIVIECSPVESICLHRCTLPSIVRTANSNPEVIKTTGDGTITYAEYDLTKAKKFCTYFRVSITDKDGKKAWTNPIFLD